MKVNHSPQWVSLKTGRGSIEVECKRGQFIFGRNSAAKELKMNATTVWKRMQKLKNMQNIDIESNSQYSVITLLNMATYQPTEIKSDSKSDKQVTSKCLASDTNKNEKNEKNEKNKDIYEISFSEFWDISPARNGKKIDKPTAMEKFSKIKESDLAKIIVAVHNYAESEMVKKGIGIKDPHRFISNRENKEYWKEWIEPEGTSGSNQQADWGDGK
jgi:biotin operon repressor